MKVSIKTPARLHLGLIDMNGDLGRMFGGLGVGIDHPNVILTAETASEFSVTGQEVELTRNLAERFFSKYQIQPKVHINVTHMIPSHVGLGSGTQLAMAVAFALTKIFKIKTSIPELALAMGRSKRTSVGTVIFQKGGFVVDGGKNLKTNAFPPLIYRHPFPKEWRFVITVPNQNKGLSNSEETNTFDKLTKMPSCDVAKICRLTMLKLLPALSEQDIQSFGEALTQIQILTGNHFAQAQGGTYCSPISSKCIDFMREIGVYGVGQSSWGPALYAVVKQEQAKPTLKKIKKYLEKSVGGEAFIARANNNGAKVKVIED